MAMFAWLIFGAAGFTAVYSGLGALIFIQQTIGSLTVSPWLILVGMQISFLFLGTLLDEGAITMITAPIYVPIIVALGFDSVWFGILFIMNMEISFMTPPFAQNIFYMKAVAPPEVGLTDIYRSIWPYIMLYIVGMVIVMIFPMIATWFPGVMLGTQTKKYFVGKLLLGKLLPI